MPDNMSPTDLTPEKSTVPPGMVQPPAPKAVKMSEAHITALRELDNVPGHGDNAKEVTKAYRASHYIQFTPVPGRTLVVTDPNDPVLLKWVERKKKVSWVVRNADGDVVRCRQVGAEAARALLLQALEAEKVK